MLAVVTRILLHIPRKKAKLSPLLHIHGPVSALGAFHRCSLYTVDSNSTVLFIADIFICNVDLNMHDTKQTLKNNHVNTV